MISGRAVCFSFAGPHPDPPPRDEGDSSRLGLLLLVQVLDTERSSVNGARNLVDQPGVLLGRHRQEGLRFKPLALA